MSASQTLPHSLSPARPRDRFGMWMLAVIVTTAAATLLLWGWRFAPVGDAAAKARLCGTMMVPLASAGLLTLWLAPRHAAVERRAARAWRHLASAVTAWWLAGVLWEILGRPPVSLADLGQLAFFPLVLLGVFGFPAVTLAPDERRRFWLDTAIVLLSGAAGVWYFALWPLLGSQHGLGGDVTEVVVNMLYPAGDLVLLFAAWAALRRGDATSRGAVAWMAGGLISRFAGDLLYSWQSLTGAYDAGGMVDLTWIAAVLLLAAGALAQRLASHAPRTTAVETDPAATPGVVSLLPYGSVLLVYAFLAATVIKAWDARTDGVLAATLCVTALVLARQYVAARENVRLHRAHARLDADRAGEARFRSLVQHSSDLIVVMDMAGEVRYASPAIERIMGLTPAAAVGRPLMSFLHPEDVQKAEISLANLMITGPAPSPPQFRVQAPGGWRAVEVAATNLSHDPAVNGVLLTVRDVTERARLEAQLVHQAFHDPLTGLANRTLFRDRVEEALVREGQEPDGVVALFLDLDDFKTVNDSLGHREGDRLLVVVAERLLNATRGCDTVARLGGDEFAVLLQNARTDDDAVVVAERIVQALSTPIALAGQEVSVGASVGIARARPGDGAEELLRNADVAMYKAKQRGKNTHEIFAPAMHAAVVNRLELEADLRRLVADGCGELVVHYQPIVRLADGRVTGVEALVRWQHPRRGLVAPCAFIPAAEATGLIVPLGRWVLREACAQAARWQARRAASSVPGEPLSVTVNLSARQLQHPGLVDDVREALTEAGLPPSSLVLEITESMIVEDTAAARATLGALKALGVRLAIDDFGTGYSSLGYLQQFPIDVLKIDRAFVEGIARGGPRAALARTIVALGDSLALPCVAEGIEDDVQRKHLQALGCVYGQGYLFARPLPPAEVEPLVCDVAPAERRAAA
jgi:diguanylate cyclase (GGDEF)-like protein/PAS domain S-box-containing protein